MNAITDNRKILLALQFYRGDKQQAMEVARLIADLEPGMSERADFLFFSRWDTEQDIDTVKYVSRKFHVSHAKCRQRAEMWPHAPNCQWFGVMDYSYAHIDAKKVPPYKAILTFEADACPLVPNWISDLSAAWDSANVKVYGALQSAPAPHINGNAMFSGEIKFLHWISRQVGGCSPHGGWDFLLAKDFFKWGWKNCEAMRSWWNCQTLPERTYQSLTQQNVVFLHGVKDNSVIQHVRKRFLRG